MRDGGSDVRAVCILTDTDERLTPRNPFPPCFGSSSGERGARSPPPGAGGLLPAGWRRGRAVWRAAGGAALGRAARGRARRAGRRNGIVQRWRWWRREERCEPDLAVTLRRLTVGPRPPPVGAAIPGHHTAHLITGHARLAPIPPFGQRAPCTPIITYLVCGI